MRMMGAHSRWAGKNTGWWLPDGRALLLLFVLLIPAAGRADSLPTRPDLQELFALVGRMHNLDPDLLEAIAEVESGGNSQAVSPKGALGLMQLMPATADTFSVLDPFNPAANVIGAADFLDYLRNRLANNLNLQGLPVLLAAYNAGPRAVEKYAGIPPYAETQKYVRRVLARYANNLGTNAAAPAVLILGGPKPYVIQLKSAPSTMQPEPVLIDTDDRGSAPAQYRVVRDTSGHLVATVATGTAPWGVRSHSEDRITLRHGARRQILASPQLR
jgi:Transglycosylase SLT domain